MRSTRKSLVPIMAFVVFSSLLAQTAQATAAKKPVVRQKVAVRKTATTKRTTTASTVVLNVPVTVALNPCSNGATEKPWAEGNQCWPHIDTSPASTGSALDFHTMSSKVMDILVPAQAKLAVLAEIKPAQAGTIRLTIFRLLNSSRLSPSDGDLLLGEVFSSGAPASSEITLDDALDHYLFTVGMADRGPIPAGAQLVIKLTRLS